jgi:hypothetical protein
MTTQEKEDKIKALVIEMLKNSHDQMVKKLDIVLSCGAVDPDSWSETDKPMILPKCIVTALLESESTQYGAKGTSYEKHVKKEVRNIRYFV